MILPVLKMSLRQLLNDMDAGNTNISEGEQEDILKLIQRITDKELSKIESANYIGVSVSTFDNYRRKGLLPEGHKRQGMNTKVWYKSDLDKYLSKK